MKKYAFLLLALLINTSWAKDFCVSSKDLTVEWKAYKTPEKAGVAGKLTKITLAKDHRAKTMETLLKDAHFSIDASNQSVNTDNKPRDIKIAKFFFSTMEGGATIKGHVTKVTKNKINMNLTMNGVTKDVPLQYKKTKNTLVAKGFIDVLDFAMADELAALNKACFALHEGKTWSDVAITLTAKLRTCK